MKHLGSLIMYCIPQQHHHNITKTRFYIIIFVFFGFVKKLLSSNTPYNFSASYKAILYFVKKLTLIPEYQNNIILLFYFTI